MSLTDFQEAFSKALLQPEFDTTALRNMPFINASALGGLQFSATRKRTLAALTAQLQGVYPTVQQVLGDDTFAEVAARYFYTHPPMTPHPVEAVEMFAYFLESQPQAKAFPFLPDVATVDLGYHKAYHAVDANTVRTSIFTELLPEELAAKRIQLHPACFWFTSSYAIFDIWRLHHSPVPPQTIDYHWPQDVIIVRPHLNVEIHRIDVGFTNALDRLDAGESLESAFVRANQIDKNFKAAAAIQFLIQNNLIVRLY